MPGQRTFTLIPQYPGRSDSPDPVQPMTSKQVQKAYKAANRGPRLSRIERIKQERAEQERIRKEFEKEKASAKARAAREKKKGKELAEKEEKRKKGLPLVTVRPSQDTISRFVRGNGTTRKRDAQGEQLKTKEAEGPVPSRLPATSSKLVDIVEENEEETMSYPNIVQAATCLSLLWPKSENSKHEKNTKERREQVEDDMDDLDDLDDFDEDPFNLPSPPALSKKPIIEEKDNADLDDLDDDFEEDLALEMLEDVEASAKKAAFKNPEVNIQQPKFQSTTIPSRITPNTPRVFNRPTRYEQDLGLKIHTPMAPPPRPSAIKLIQNNPSSSPSPPRQAPPLSTQAILLNFEDFFPSPSQQARELEDSSEEEKAPEPHPLMQPEKEPQKGPDPPEPSLPEPRAESPSPLPRRFFTSSGSHELMSLALQRSRRTAELEKIQQRDRMRIQTSMAVRNEAEALAHARRHISKPKPTTAVQMLHHRSTPKPQKAPECPPSRPNSMEARKVRAVLITHAKNIPEPLKTTNSSSVMRPMAEQIRGKTEPKTTNLPLAQIASKEKENTENKENVQKRNQPLPPNKQGSSPSASQETEYGGGDWIDEIALELII